MGNLRTALVAWLFARSSNDPFLLRFEDLDLALVAEEHYQTQELDLNALGLGWDGESLRQSHRTELYRDAIADLRRAGMTYQCFCSRRDIREASEAPNGDPRHMAHVAGFSPYPGTCRQLTQRERATKLASGRPPATRVRASEKFYRFEDLLCGTHSGPVDDFVIERNDGTPAYNLAVVLDDGLQGVEMVVRGDDLLPSTLRHLFMAEQLGVTIPAYAHVPLVLAPSGKRLAKRDGAVTLEDRLALGETAADVLTMLAASLDLADPNETVTLDSLLDRFDPSLLPLHPYTLEDNYLGGAVTPDPGHQN